MADPAREQELRALFDRAVAMPQDQRQGLLAGVTDDLLRERLQALLQQDAAGTAGILQRTPATVLEELRRIGPYEVLRELGTGGMGTVLLARQVEPVERLVALKMVRQDIDSAGAVERFEQERQTLALLQHPGIAMMYEAGTSADGRLYISMEYVRGEPITDYCDRRRLDVAARIELFLVVCDAVQHAHQKAVLHRDLKPGNVLVTEDGGLPRPKIIDFGVARALWRAPGQRLLAGDERDVVGTWHYMSPEQADPAGQDIDTRSDIYSLGVLLHELLTGELPLGPAPAVAASGDATPLLRFRESLLRDVPPLASVRCAALPDVRAQQCAAQRGLAPRQLQRQLRGELDAILATALAKDRNARYATAAELRGDLLRWLRREAVSVVPATLRYRAMVLVRRHRPLVVMAALGGLALVGTLIATAYGLQMERHARAVAASAQRKDQLERVRESARADFFDLLLLHADPGTVGTPPDLRAVLDQLEPLIDRRHHDRPEAAAVLRAALGRAWLGLGEPSKAEVQLSLAWQSMVPEEDPLRAFLLLNDLAQAVRRVRGPGAARPYEVRLLEVGVRALAGPSPDLAAAVAGLAASIRESAQEGPIQQACAAVLDRLDGLPADSDELRIGGTLMGLFLLALHESGHIAGGGALLPRLEHVVRRAIDEDVGLQPVLGRYAESLLDIGACDDARRLAGSAIVALDRLGLGSHWLRLRAERVHGLALALGGQPAAGEAELMELSFRLGDLPSTANEQSRRAATALRELGERLQRSGRLKDYLRESLRLWQSRAEADPSVLPWWPADVEQLAEPVLQAALDVVEKEAPPGAAGHALRGALLLRRERYADALAQLELARTGAAVPTPELLRDLVLCLRSAGRTDDAALVLGQLGARARNGDARSERGLQRAERMSAPR